MADEERKPIYDAYVASSKSWISIWVVPFLCTDDETLARHYLPYLLEGDPEEPTKLVIQEYLPESTPENPVVQQRVICREAAPEGMGTPPEAWVQLLILNAENTHRASDARVGVGAHGLSGNEPRNSAVLVLYGALGG